MLTKIPRLGKLSLATLACVVGFNISASSLQATSKVWASTSAFIIVKNRTFFKQDYQKQASALPLTDKYEAQTGERFYFSYIEPDVNQFNGHLRVHFDPALKPQQGSSKQTWYVFATDISEIKPTGK